MQPVADHQQPDQVHYTLFCRELSSCQTADGISFTVARPPGVTVSAQRVRLLGDVSQIEADGWMVLDDSTASVDVVLLTPARPAVGALVEVIGDLQVGCRPQVDLRSQSNGPVRCVHVRARHLCVHEDPEYRQRRWRTLDRQRANERDAPLQPQAMAPATHLAPAPAAHLAPAPEVHADGVPPTPTLRDGILGHLATAAGGLLHDELHKLVLTLLAAPGDTGARELEEALAALEEDFLVYKNGGRYFQL